MVNDTSSSGTYQVYEDGDQRNAPKSEADQLEDKFHQGNQHSHNAFDSSTLTLFNIAATC